MRGDIPPLPQYVFMAWCLVKHRDFTFTLFIYKLLNNGSSFYLTLEKQLSNCPPFMESEGSLLCSQGPATGLYPEPDKFDAHLPTLFP
jgi:hypothetical protein